VAEEDFGTGVTVDAFGHGFLPEEHRASRYSSASPNNASSRTLATQRRS
jgi:hypothetical protein